MCWVSGYEIQTYDHQFYILSKFFSLKERKKEVGEWREHLRRCRSFPIVFLLPLNSKSPHSLASFVLQLSGHFHPTSSLSYTIPSPVLTQVPYAIIPRSTSIAVDSLITSTVVCGTLI